MRRRILSKEAVIAACGIVLAIIGILATVLGLKPEEWPDKIDSWAIVFKGIGSDVFDNRWKVIISLIIGLPIGYYLRRARSPNVLAAAEFSRRFQELFEQNDIRTLLIFGYTYETVRDYQKYEHLYEEGLEIRVLNRCWIAEKIDEGIHNSKVEGLNIRRWRKSDTIHQAALAPWTYKARREVKYYDFTHPIIKGVVLKSKSSTWAFVNFYKWQEMPSDGGSQFKGADLGMIFLDGAISEERIKIDALVSQFELIWKYRSYSVEQSRPEYRSYIADVQ